MRRTVDFFFLDDDIENFQILLMMFSILKISKLFKPIRIFPESPSRAIFIPRNKSCAQWKVANPSMCALLR
jgi:hypothetical protein